MDACLHLFQQGNDIIWLDIEKLRSKPNEWIMCMHRIVPSILSFMNISKFNSIGFGHGAGFILSLLSISQGIHICVNPKPFSGEDFSETKILGDLRSAKFQIWVLSSEMGSLLQVSEILRRERISSMRSKFDPLIVSTVNISLKKIPGDSLGRSFYLFPDKSSLARFLAETTAKWVIEDFSKNRETLIA